MPNKCAFPGCPRYAIGETKMCVGHRQYAAMDLTETKPKPVAKKSAKMKVSHKEYKKIVIELFRVSKKCEINSPVCTRIAQGLHHVRKRGEHLLNKEFLKRACNACNAYLENNVSWGEENGFIKSKHTAKDAS